MNSTQLSVELPYSISSDEARVLLAIKLFEAGRATLGQAAKVAGFSRHAFIDVLGGHQIPVINYSPEELRAEISA